MPALLRRGSIALIGGLLLVGAVACSSDTTTTTDTTAGTSTSTSAAPGTTAAAPGTTAGTTPPSGGTATTVTTEAGAPASTATTTGGGQTDPSVPIVDPASTEAFCALDSQINDLSEAQLKDANPSDAESFRALLAKFLTDNAAVIDQYVAAAPPEIADDVEATIAETRDAVNDPAKFEQVMSGSSEVSDRVSAFIDANCTR